MAAAKRAKQPKESARADFEKDAKSKTASLQKKAKDAKQHATKVGDSLRALEQSGQQAEMDLKEARDEAKAVAAGQAVLGESIASAKAELAKQEAEFAQHEVRAPAYGRVFSHGVRHAFRHAARGACPCLGVLFGHAAWAPTRRSGLGRA